MSTENAIGINANYTEEENKNIKICLEYMKIAYDPKQATAKNVAHLCTNDSKFIGQSTFPLASTVPEYSEVHGQVMKSISSLKLEKYNLVSAKEKVVTLRYTASGTFDGQEWHGVKANNKSATWHAAVIFELEGGKIKTMFKEWDKALMWKQLQLPEEEYTDVEKDLSVTLKNK
eukprot:TRINITY_DN3769_c0_g1_i1.p1 TRINITY_DN3769_c0_g1~~TRINITY_DN3769_c0_g1_i1.p1  ORF type:complete len:174 (+),score=42.05 TRINITY_DN3769_c0_g1_i1:64-585(+)